MTNPLKMISLLAGTALLAASNLSAATTDPVGYVTNTVNPSTDLLVGVTLQQPPSFTGAADSVSGNTIAVSSTIPDVTTEPHYVWVTSGNVEGQWFEVTSATASSVTVSEDLSAEGMAATDRFRVVPFWTLSTLLPEGGGMPVTNDLSAVQSLVLSNDVTAEGLNLAAAVQYFYFSNGSGVSGWLRADDQSQFFDDTVVPPSTFITLRNVSTSESDVIISGSVPVNPISNQIVSRSAGAQDNQVYFPYPSDVLLGDLGLVESGAISSTDNLDNPTEFLLVYSLSSTVKNPGAVEQYFHFDNNAGVSGWLKANDQSQFFDDIVTIPGSSALVIRKAASSDSVVEWAPPLPYSL